MVKRGSGSWELLRPALGASGGELFGLLEAVAVRFDVDHLGAVDEPIVFTKPPRGESDRLLCPQGLSLPPTLQADTSFAGEVADTCPRRGAGGSGPFGQASQSRTVSSLRTQAERFARCCWLSRRRGKPAG